MHECDRDKGMGALLHNLKRALLLEDSMNVKKIRRFEDFSPPCGAVMQPRPGQVVGKWAAGDVRRVQCLQKGKREIRHEALHKTQKE
jgi:hypothetical protein